MTTYPNDRLESSYRRQARMPFRTRSIPVPGVRGRRTPERRIAAQSAPGLTQALSIEETIARYVDDNPTQLYRGGA
jgi:hypothetical protein